MASFASRWVRHVAWVSLWGPLLSLLPRSWRGRKANQLYGDWALSAVISGIFEFSVALEIAWTWFGNHLERPMLLWMALYLAMDGAWRALSAHTSDEAPGTLLLALAEQAAELPRRLRSSFSRALPDLVTLDEAHSDWQLKIESSWAKRDWQPGRLVRWEAEEKPAGRDRYFQLLAANRLRGPRPFVYLLRALPVGVPGPQVLTYSRRDEAPSRG